MGCCQIFRGVMLNVVLSTFDFVSDAILVVQYYREDLDVKILATVFLGLGGFILLAQFYGLKDAIYKCRCGKESCTELRKTNYILEVFEINLESIPELCINIYVMGQCGRTVLSSQYVSAFSSILFIAYTLYTFPRMIMMQGAEEDRKEAAKATKEKGTKGENEDGTEEANEEEEKEETAERNNESQGSWFDEMYIFLIMFASMFTRVIAFAYFAAFMYWYWIILFLVVHWIALAAVKRNEVPEKFKSLMAFFVLFSWLADENIKYILIYSGLYLVGNTIMLIVASVAPDKTKDLCYPPDDVFVPLVQILLNISVVILVIVYMAIKRWCGECKPSRSNADDAVEAAEVASLCQCFEC